MNIFRKRLFESSGIPPAPPLGATGETGSLYDGLFRRSVPVLLLVVLALNPGMATAQADALLIGNASILEGNSGTSVLKLPVSFTAGASPNNVVTGTVSAIPRTCSSCSPATGGTTCGGSVDFEQFTVPFSIPANTPNGTLSVNITICGDTGIEPAEQIFVAFSNVSGFDCLSDTCAGIGTILDDDTPAIITDLSSVFVPEGGTKTFQVKLSKAPPSGSATVNVARTAGDADITVQSGTPVTFDGSHPFDSFQPVTLAAAQDADTTKGVATILCSGPSLNGAAVTATESDNDMGISINDISTKALPGLDRTAFFNVSLSLTNFTDVTVHYTTRDGTAKGRSLTRTGDYLPTSGTLLIPRLAGSATIPVTIVGDLDANSETFFVDLSSPSRGTTIADGTGLCTVLPANVLSTGVFDLRTAEDRVRVGDTVNYALSWTVPENEVWRDLETIDFRLRKGNENALWVHWDEAANAFSVCDGDGTGDSGVHCTAGEAPGSPTILETEFAQLHLAECSVIGSGPTGPTVTLNLAISFKEALGSCDVELAASDDFGIQDDFVGASKLLVRGVREQE